MSTASVHEDVPALIRRNGDCLLASANNSSLLLGRDRISNPTTGYGSLAAPGGGTASGAAHLIVGRQGLDPSLLNDAATLYLSAKNDPDKTANTESIGTESSGVSAALMRADCIRIIPRKDFKISVGSAFLTIESGGTVVIEGDISLGKDAAERLLRGEAWNRFWTTLTIPTPMGPSGPPPPIPSDVFSSTVRVK